VLEDQEGLIELDLSMNNITDPGGVPLARSMAVNVTLQVMRLRHNALSSTTAEVFNAVLKEKNATLQYLDVGNTGLQIQERNALQVDNTRHPMHCTNAEERAAGREY
jgi:hypothetical protein